MHVANQKPGSAWDAELKALGDEDSLRKTLAATDNVPGVCSAWLSIQCGYIPYVRAGLLLLEQRANTYAPVAVWPREKTEAVELSNAGHRCLIERNDLVQRNPSTGSVFVACPLELDDHLHGAVVLDILGRSDGDLKGVTRQLHWGLGWLQNLLTNCKVEEGAERLVRAQIALDVLAVASEQRDLKHLASAVSNDLAARFRCDRVSFGVERRGRVRLLGFSHSAYFEKKSQFVASLQDAMDESLDQRRSIRWPLREEDVNPGVAIAHGNYAKNRCVCSALINHCGRGIGVLIFERDGDDPFTDGEIAGFETIGVLLGALVADRICLDHWFAGRVPRAIRGFLRHLGDPRRPALSLGLALAAIAFLALVMVTTEYRVSAEAVVEGETQRALVAPFEGFIQEAPVRAGMIVTKDEPLARLDDRDLQIERRQWRAERDQHERRYRDALYKHERTEANVALAQMAEAEAQLALVEEKIARATLAAPFDGIVVTGDLTQMLGTPVEQGKLLFEVAPLEDYRVILKVDDRDIRNVQPGQTGQLVLAGLTSEVLSFKVVNISMPEAEDGKNLFRVEARLDRSDVPLRPGMEGIGKVVVGERSYGWIWTHRFFDWLRLKIWAWLP